MKLCGKKTEVYSRVCGYHRPINTWNKGKKEEFLHRKVFDVKNTCKINEEHED